MFELAHRYGGYYVLNRNKDNILVTDGKKLSNFVILKDKDTEYFLIGKTKRVYAK